MSGNPILADLDSHMNSNGFVLGTSCGPRPMTLSEAYGAPRRLSDDPVCREGESPVLRSLDEYRGSDGFVEDRVLEIDEETDVRLADVVSRFLVEVRRRFIGGGTQYKRSMVLCRPAVAVKLDLQSDAFVPMVCPDGNGMDLRYVPPRKPCGVVEIDSLIALGYMFGWTDEGTAYNAVLGPRPYEARPKETVVVPDLLWEWYIPAVLDLLGQQSLDLLCLDLIDNRFEPDEWFFPHGMEHYRSADSILAGGGGAMV